MNHINKKTKIGITTKVVNNYYLKKYIAAHEQAAVLPELAEGGLANRICASDSESELTLYDVNLFLKYIGGVSGTGSQGEKSQKIIDTVEKISKKEGVYFLKLIDHKITIGAKEKTFKNAKIAKSKAK
jgi:ATP-dependent DNA ligase